MVLNYDVSHRVRLPICSSQSGEFKKSLWPKELIKKYVDKKEWQVKEVGEICSSQVTINNVDYSLS